MTTKADRIRIVEVAARDGLQNEPQAIPVATRVELIRRLSTCGFTDIEAGAFVSPRWVPQMADTARVFSALAHGSGTPNYWVLAPNLKGYQDAKTAGATHIAVFTAASETFSRKNTNASIEESLARIEEVAKAAKANHAHLRGYVSCALGCPYEGEVAPAKVIEIAEKLLHLGCSEVSIGDTIGTGTLKTTRALFKPLTEAIPAKKLAAHFHDTYGQALANLTVAMDYGIRTIDAAVAGLGGCPYATGASGNVSTEDVVHFCHGQGLETGIDEKKLASVGAWISSQLHRPNASHAGRAVVARLSKP